MMKLQPTKKKCSPILRFVILMYGRDLTIQNLQVEQPPVTGCETTRKTSLKNDFSKFEESKGCSFDLLPRTFWQKHQGLWGKVH